ncbi:hypothetical protein B0H14DRAFT_375783 [Mycena olivaceomarginata]|nr:hypothetical protein B0H14DRAFT_375783 [Mycena olivaceomarginata]
MSASATADMRSTPTAVRIPPDLVDARSYSTLYDDAVPPWDVGRSWGGTAHGALLRSFLRVPPRSIWRVRVARRRGTRGAGCGVRDMGRVQRRVDRARRWGAAVASLAFTLPEWRSWVRDGEKKEGIWAVEREALHFTGQSYALDSRASTLALASQLLDLDEARNKGWKAHSARRGVLDVGRERACHALTASSCSCIRPRAELATIPAGAMKGGSVWRWMCTDERAKGKDVSGRA